MSDKTVCMVAPMGGGRVYGLFSNMDAAQTAADKLNAQKHSVKSWIVRRWRLWDSAEDAEHLR